MEQTVSIHADYSHFHGVTGPERSNDSWYAVWTRSHCEQLVRDQLLTKGLSVFLPQIETWSKRRNVKQLIRLPMFPGYLFVRNAAERRAHLEIIKTRGVVRLLGEGWDRLVPVPAEEMEAIARLAATRVRAFPHPYLQCGQRARVVAGPLAGIEGILVERRPSQGVLVLSVHMLQRSVAILVDGVDVVPS